MDHMNLTVYTGLPGTGKTSTLIKAMRESQEKGGKVVLFLSAEHPELTRRPNVRPGGLMGCRKPGLNFPIDHVLKTHETIERLEALESGTMAVFDEAQYFKPEIVDAWNSAANRGVEILVGTPSKVQLDWLETKGRKPIELTVPCKCGKKNATSAVYKEDMTYPTHLCDDCRDKHQQDVLDALFNEIQESDPFPGERKTYQPFFNVDREQWDYVRADSLARFQLIQDAVKRCAPIQNTAETSGVHFSYLDLGCCSGFFCDAMTTLGFSSTGVDVTKNFIDWANRMAKLKGHNIDYVCKDAKQFLENSDDMIDVTSTFATIQWVMAQQGYEAGVECFEHLFKRTRHIAIVEMGYTLEDIYKDRIPDRSREIDKNWVLDIMQEYGNFAEVEVYPAGENGIWRDVFMGYKEAPARRPFRRRFENEEVDQISVAQQSWDDKWTGQDFEVFLRSKKALKQGRLTGWIPDHSDDKYPDIVIYIDGVNVKKLTVEGNEFDCLFECDKEPGIMFCLRIESTPARLDATNDIRPLAFIMNKVSFS